MTRFNAKVSVDPATGCWLWTSVLNSAGYARIGVPDPWRFVLAHRWIYEHVNGPIPDGLVIDHICFVKRCVNPDHLQAITPAANYRRSVPLRTHCTKGHELTPENTFRDATHHQRCRTCSRESARQRMQRTRKVSG